jgi:hypothetical protein
MGANAELTAGMREAIVIQPSSCKLFGPTWSGVVSSTAMCVAKPPCGVPVLGAGEKGAAYKAALFCRNRTFRAHPYLGSCALSPWPVARALSPRVGDFARGD